MTAKQLPKGYHSINATLNVEGATKLIDFAKKVFGAEEASRMPGPDGKLLHAEIKIGDSVLMLSEAQREPATRSSLYIYVNDADATFQKALSAGATSLSQPVDMFWGDRIGRVRDPFGNTWSIATHTEDVSETEMTRRAQTFMKEQARQHATA